MTTEQADSKQQPTTPKTTDTEDEDYSLVSLEGQEQENSSVRRQESSNGTTTMTTTDMFGEQTPLLSLQDETFIQTQTGPKIHPMTSPFHPKNHGNRPRITQAYRRQRYETRKQVFACALATLSGFSDILCYHSFGCYGNMMTGNTIKLMDHMAAGRWTDAIYPAALVPAYILGAALCTWLNKVDLTVLGLGGPSNQAFSHLNPPRRLRSPQQISVLRVVALGCVFLFLVGEVFGKFIIQADRWRLPFFACAFGLLNAATLAAIHLVTNAVTGHWITVGLGVADDLPVLLNRQSSRTDGTTASSGYNYISEQNQMPQTDSQKKWKSSMSVAASFIGSIIVTSLLYNECLREVEHHPDWPLALIFIYAPPMGVMFSILYTALLYWYTLPPPFLQGFHSRVDLSDF